MKRKQIIIVFLLSILSGCQFGMYKEKIIDNYFLTFVDTESDLSLSYDLGDGSFIGVVNDAVFAVGYNSNFIIVKNHPLVEPDSINRKVTNYFIIQIDRNISQFKVVENKIGPLSKQEFDKMRKKLKIPVDLDFTVVKDENK